MSKSIPFQVHRWMKEVYCKGDHFVGRLLCIFVHSIALIWTTNVNYLMDFDGRVNIDSRMSKDFASMKSSDLVRNMACQWNWLPPEATMLQSLDQHKRLRMAKQQQFVVVCLSYVDFGTKSM